jgi:hypothetical protein
MKKNGLNLSELKKILKKWQEILLLENWLLSIKIVDFKRKDYRQSGDIKVDSKNKKATILLTYLPFRDEETTIVHELIHLLLWDFDHYCEKLALKSSKLFTGDHDKYLDQLEKIVAKITKILFLKYKK